MSRSLLDQRRDAALAVFRAVFADCGIRAASRRVRRDRVEFDFADGSSGLIHVASHRGDLHVGEFELLPTVMLSGGPLHAVLGSLGLDPGGGFAHGRVLTATMKISGGRQDTWAFRSGTDVERQARRMSIAASRSFGSVLEAFTGDYGRAARIVSAEPRWVPLPWCSAFALFELAGQSDQAEALLELPRSRPGSFPELREPGRNPEALAAAIRQAVLQVARE